MVAAGARIHRTGEHELGGIGQRYGGPGNGHVPIFQGLSEYDAGVLIDKGRAIYEYFEAVLAEGIEPKAAANWVINDLLGQVTGRIKVIGDLPVEPAADAAAEPAPETTES